ncbi:MAG: FAD-dependent oxidoreductase [Gemmatimonadetes bacterium]|nr:FAD-dependent oxidoreductase [Gemmatimonadota bacterium]
MTEDPIFRPFRIGSLGLPNRVVMTTVKLGYATPAGEATGRHIAFYARRAAGGVGLLTTEPLYVQVRGRELPTQMGIHDEALVPGLTKMVASVHASGGRIMAHLNHAGRAVNPRLVPEGERVSASDVPCPANQVTPRPLDVEGIDDIVEAFGTAADRARRAGFDAIEIPFSHGYLVHQFLSPHTNRRDDAYGGSFENRLRFGRQVLGAVRDVLGPDFPVVVRMNAVDYVEGGLGVEDALMLAARLRDLDVDALSVTSGTMCESVPFCLYPAGTPKAHLLPMAQRIREASGLPTIVAGRIRSPDVARQALVEGQTDLVGLARPLLADPDWVRKTEEGDEEAILLCAACHQGCLGDLRKGRGTGCLFNPFTGRESEIEITSTPSPRDVVVVGGGPAGLEAARVAAERGHRVALFEERDHLGGQLFLAGQVPHKEGFLDGVRHLELMTRRAGVDVHLGVQVTPGELRDRRPDAVVVATGGIALSVAFPGLENTRWVLATDVLEGRVDVDTPHALLIGGGLVGLEAADFLAARGTKVTLVEMQEEVGTGLDMLPRAMLLKRLTEGLVDIHVRTRVTRLDPDVALAERDGDEIRIPIETVVLAVGVRPNRALLDGLEGSGLEVHVVGDALEPRGAAEAILEGLEVALRL